MIAFESALILRLRGALGTAAVYGGKRAPQGATGNYVLVWELASRRLYSHDGKTPLVEAIYNIDCFVKKPEEGKTWLALIEASIADFSGLLGTVPVSGIFLEDTLDDDFRSDIGYHVLTANYLARY